MTKDVRASRKKIVQANDIVVHRASVNFTRPTGHERFPVAAFVNAAFGLPQWRIGPSGRAVVAGGNEKGILFLTGSFQRIHDLAQHVITLIDPVGVFALLAGDPALADELGRRNNRAVGRAHGEIEEKRLLLPGTLLDVLDGLADHQRLVLDPLHVGHHPVLLNDRADVAGVGKAIEIINAKRVGAIDEPGANGKLLFRARHSIDPIHAEMPLADAGGVVATALKKGGHCETALGNDRGRVGLQHAKLANSGWIPAGQQSVSGWRAVGRRRVRVSEAHALLGQVVEIGRLEGRISPVGLRLAVADIIEENENNIGRLLRLGQNHQWQQQSNQSWIISNQRRFPQEQ